MSSIDRCLVSGIVVLTNINEQIHKPAKIKNVLEIPTIPNSIGKTNVTRKLKIHRQKIVIPIAVERILVGKISEIISQVAGDTQDCWNPKR